MNYGKRRRNDMSLLDALNEPQRQAVMATDGPLLILAGPSSFEKATIGEDCKVIPFYHI